jgi:hypothetical protein
MDILEDDRATLDLTVTDRRRPGRADYQEAHLIALLRGEPTNANSATAEGNAVPKVRWTDDLSPDLSPARGLLIGLPIGAAMWAAIIFAVWHFT